MDHPKLPRDYEIAAQRAARWRQAGLTHEAEPLDRDPDWRARVDCRARSREDGGERLGPCWVWR